MHVTHGSILRRGMSMSMSSGKSVSASAVDLEAVLLSVNESLTLALDDLSQSQKELSLNVTVQEAHFNQTLTMAIHEIRQNTVDLANSNVTVTNAITAVNASLQQVQATFNETETNLTALITENSRYLASLGYAVSN